MTTPDPKALRAIARDATQEWSAKVSEIHEGAEGDAYGFAAFGPTHDYEGDEERYEEAQDQAEADARYIAAVSPPVVLALLDRIEAAERDRDRLRDDAQRLVDGWRAEADRARATGLTIEAVRGLVEAWDRTDISFSRLVEDLRTLAMVRAETAERERDEARAALIRSQEDHRAAVEALETYEERIGDIADHVLGLVPPDVPSIVKLDAIERRCGDERVAARQAEAEVARLRRVEEAARAVLAFEWLTHAGEDRLKEHGPEEWLALRAALNEGSKSDG